MKEPTVFTEEKILVNLIDNYDDAVDIFRLQKITIPLPQYMSSINDYVE